MKTLLSFFCLLAIVFFIPQANAGFEGLNQNVSLKIFNRLNCGTGTLCTRTKTGVFNLQTSGTGVLHNIIPATATTITVSQCGSTFVNSAATLINLPVAANAIGCNLTFVTGNASNFDVNPDDASQILVETSALGHAIRNATLGDTITLRAISATQWVVVGILGTYTDIN